jgi:hypothetical protein
MWTRLTLLLIGVSSGQWFLDAVARITIALGFIFILGKIVPRNKVFRCVVLFPSFVLFGVLINYVDAWTVGSHRWAGLGHAFLLRWLPPWELFGHHNAATQTAVTDSTFHQSMTTMTSRVARISSAVLLASGLVVYVAAKIDFFRHYGSMSAGAYLREHSVYWIAIAALGLLVWLIEISESPL